MRRDTSPTLLTRSMTKEFENDIGMSPNNVLASGKSRKGLLQITPLLQQGSMGANKFLPSFGSGNPFLQ